MMALACLHQFATGEMKRERARAHTHNHNVIDMENMR